MIDIIPAAAFASAAAYIKRESQPDENQEFSGGVETPPQPEDLGSEKPPKKEKKKRSALFIIAIVKQILRVPLAVSCVLSAAAVGPPAPSNAGRLSAKAPIPAAEATAPVSGWSAGKAL